MMPGVNLRNKINQALTSHISVGIYSGRIYFGFTVSEQQC